MTVRMRPALLRWGGLVLVAAILVGYPLLATSSFLRGIGVLAIALAIAATGWNVLGGYAGQISFGHAVFFGTGMYGTTLLAVAGWSPWTSMLPIAAISAVFGLLIALPTFRLRGHYFSIATLAIGLMVQSVLPNVNWLGGADGLSVPLTSYGLWNLQFSPRDPTSYYYTGLALFAVVTAASVLFLRGRTGSNLQALRDDDRAAAAIGVPVLRSKLVAVAVSAAITSIAGSFQVMAVAQFVDPSSSVDLSISTAIAVAAVIGGAGSAWGPLLGAWLVVLLQQTTRTYLSATGRSTDLVLYGTLIVGVMLIDPAGLVNLITRGWRRLRRRSGSSAGTTSPERPLRNEEVDEPAHR